MTFIAAFFKLLQQASGVGQRTGQLVVLVARSCCECEVDALDVAAVEAIGVMINSGWLQANPVTSTKPG